MKGYVVAVLAILTGCATAESMRTHKPVFDLRSDKPLAELAGCIALQLSGSPGYEIGREQFENRYAFSLKFRAAGIAARAGTIDIFFDDRARRVVGYATGRKSGAPFVIISKARSCI